MAALNKVEKRIITAARCDGAALKQIPWGRGIGGVDCEGYEKTLFTDDVVKFLSGTIFW